jgi:hypothetical protein
MDMEYEGGTVTDEESYSFYYTLIDGGEVEGGHFGRPANVSIGDMDNDGHLEIVATVPWSGANPVDNLLGLYVFEFDLTDEAPSGDNADLTLAWHEADDEEYGRGYTLKVGFDIDEDGRGEMLVYERLNESSTVYKISLFEADDDNSYTEVWSYQFDPADIGGGERGLMVTDWDDDGFSEITAIMQTVVGVDNLYVWEWDGTDNGLPSTPTAQFDIARDTERCSPKPRHRQYLWQYQIAP